MKKLAGLLAALSLMLVLSGCGGRDVEIKIVIPAGTTETFVYSEEEISPKRNRIEVRVEAGAEDTAVLLQPVSGEQKQEEYGTYLTPGMPVKLEAEKGEWYRIGVKVPYSTDEREFVFHLTISNANVRIE